MKINFLFLAAIIFVIAFFSFTKIYNPKANNIDVYVNNKIVNYDEKPTLLNDQTMVPIRLAMEALGSTVKWEENAKKVSIEKGQNQVQLHLDNKIAHQNGMEIELETAPFVKSGRTYVPLRFISEGLNYGVSWDGKTYNVNISNPPKLASQNVQIPILMYHHIEPNQATGSVISPERFREHMTAIKNKGYQTITDRELFDFLQNNKTLPYKPIMITFDDGYKSNYTYAYPVLKELGMKASINLISSRVVGEKNPYPNEIPKMSWEEARKSMDVFSFQGHTYDLHYKGENAQNRSRGMITGRMHLPNGKLETQAEYEARLLNDLTLSKKMIEENLKTEVITCAYPYGDYTDDTIRIAKKAGYKMALTTQPGKESKKSADLFRLHRINGHGELTAIELMEELSK
jgi:peptidoglycan/xylan/chitin deacetylase (PgdA/CDA1 family)